MQISAILCNNSLHVKNNVILNGRKRRVPKDGVWAIGTLRNMIDPDKLTDYKKRMVNMQNWLKQGSLERVLRRTFTQDNGKVKYTQDRYSDGKLITRIIKRKPNGELISCKKWTEYIV